MHKFCACFCKKGGVSLSVLGSWLTYSKHLKNNTEVVTHQGINSNQNTYLGKVDESTQKPGGRPHWPFWGPMEAILDFAIPGTFRLVFLYMLSNSPPPPCISVHLHNMSCLQLLFKIFVYNSCSQPCFKILVQKSFSRILLTTSVPNLCS